MNLNDMLCKPDFSEPPPPERHALTREDGGSMLPMGKMSLIEGPADLERRIRMAELAISWTTGRPWLGRYKVPKDSRGLVLWCLDEPQERGEFKRLLLEARESMGGFSEEELEAIYRGLTSVTFWSHEDHQRRRMHFESLLFEPREERRVGLIIVDEYARVMGRDRKTYEVLKYLAMEYDVAVVLGHPTVPGFSEPPFVDLAVAQDTIKDGDRTMTMHHFWNPDGRR